MKLPNHENLVIPKAKITKYLLNKNHPKGTSKATFFTAFGFSVAEWEVMRTALIEHAKQHEVSEVNSMPNGTHYIIEGALNCPDGRSSSIRIVWRIDANSEIP